MESNFRMNASPAADAPWRATVSRTLQHPQGPQPVPSESCHRRPDPCRPHGYTDVVRDDRLPTVDTAGNRRQDEAREDMYPPVENAVAWGQPQEPRYGYYDMAYEYPPPDGPRDHGVADYAGIAQDDPTEALVNQPAHDINPFGDAGLHAAAGPAQAFLDPDEWPYQDPIPNGPGAENLQRIAIHLQQPNLRVSLIHMEPDHAGGVKVVITLEMADF